MIKILRRVPSWTLPAALSLLAFTMTVGWKVVNPAHVQWLMEGDPAISWLGWLFYRDTPWTLPLWANPSCGLETSSTVLFTDSNPPMALIGKILSPLLPVPCQYVGLWLLICFLLQGWFGWKLMGLLTQNSWARLCGTGLFLFAPPFLWRLHIHFTLVGGQTLLLAALYLCLGPPTLPRLRGWVAVIGFAAILHGYILLMVSALWLTDLLRRGCTNRDFLKLGLEILLVVIVTVLGLTQVGAFSIGREAWSADGFGYYRMNLLAPINPTDQFAWSYLLPALPQGNGDYEGFNYLGLGVLFALAAGLPTLFLGWKGFRFSWSFVPLILLNVGFILFAISNVPGVGRWNAPAVPLPDWFMNIAAIFRSSGRFFWPTFYLLLFLGVRNILLLYRPAIAAGVLTVALLAQVIDTSAAWLPYQRQMTDPKDGLTGPLSDPFWKGDFAGYTKLRVVPPDFLSWGDPMASLAYFAHLHGMGTDAIYFARTNPQKVEALREDDDSRLKTGNFALDTIYILNDDSAVQARLTINPKTDLLIKADQFTVLLPGGKEHHSPGLKAPDK